MEIVRFIKGMEQRVLPYLQPRLNERRIIHIRAVNNAFNALVEGRYQALYDALIPKLQAETNYDLYCRKLAGIRAEYQALSPKEKLDLAAAVVLHDVGYLEDPGMNHNDRGRELGARFLMITGTEQADRDAVAELIYGHGFYNDATSQYLPADLKHFSPARKTQLLIMSLMDVAGKPNGSLLSERVLQTMIALKDGVYEKPQPYFSFRLRSLLGPTNYSYLEDERAYASLVETIRSDISKEDREALFRNVVGRFRNMCWPVFQELVINYHGVREFLTILLRLSGLADECLPASKDVLLVFEPDFFSLTTEQRRPYLEALKCNPNEDILTVSRQDEPGIILIDLRKLVNNTADPR